MVKYCVAYATYLISAELELSVPRVAVATKIVALHCPHRSDAATEDDSRWWFFLRILMVTLGWSSGV